MEIEDPCSASLCRLRRIIGRVGLDVQQFRLSRHSLGGTVSMAQSFSAILWRDTISGRARVERPANLPSIRIIPHGKAVTVMSNFAQCSNFAKCIRLPAIFRVFPRGFHRRSSQPALTAIRLAFLVAVASVVGPSTVFSLAADELPVSDVNAADSHQLTVFMRDGGWCWFQDPRAIIHEGKLIIGGIGSNGDAVVGVYDLENKKPLGRVVVHKELKRDDHNSPVFFARRDGRILTVYAQHGRNRIHYYRISNSNDLLSWGAEQRFEHDYPSAGNVTYMNLHGLEKEGKLYNFFRGIEYNPSYITSTDGGETWNEPTHLIQDELSGRQRPYARYTSDGRDTIYISFTEAHPRQFGTSIYFAAFRDGKFYRADGTLIKDLSEDGPLKPSEADKVFQGGGGQGRGNLLSADRSAWTSSIVLDKAGNPHIAYTLYLSNTDHRYRVASWNGEQWVDREVAYGGKCLYERESSYTGLISLQTGDPTGVVISTNVDPTTGEERSGQHEIYRAKVELADSTKTIRWHPVTANSAVCNIRPVIVTGEGYRVTLWMRGEFTTYTNFRLDVVGTVRKDASGTEHES